MNATSVYPAEWRRRQWFTSVHLLRFHVGNELQAMKGRPAEDEKEKSSRSWAASTSSSSVTDSGAPSVTVDSICRSVHTAQRQQPWCMLRGPPGILSDCRVDDCCPFLLARAPGARLGSAPHGFTWWRNERSCQPATGDHVTTMFKRWRVTPWRYVTHVIAEASDSRH